MTAFLEGHGGHDRVLVRLRGADDVFEGRNKSAARRARNATIRDMADFDRDPQLAVVLKWANREVWQVRRDGSWLDVCMTKDRGDT